MDFAFRKPLTVQDVLPAEIELWTAGPLETPRLLIYRKHECVLEAKLVRSEPCEYVFLLPENDCLIAGFYDGYLMDDCHVCDKFPIQLKAPCKIVDMRVTSAGCH